MSEKWSEISKIFLIFIVCLVSIFFTIINFLPSKHFQNLRFNLGLDLQGGADLLLEINFDEYLKDRVFSSKDVIARELRKAKIGYTNLTSDATSIKFNLRSQEDAKKVESVIKKIDGFFSVEKGLDGGFKVLLTSEAIAKMRQAVKEQSIEIIRRRIDEKGNKEISVQAGGDNKIFLQVPGVKSTEEIKNLLNVTAKLSFHLMDETAPFFRIKPDTSFQDSKILKGYVSNDIYYVVKNAVEIDGASLINANTSINNAEAGVSFELDVVGARRFAEITRANVGRPFAIVLDNKVLSAPTIREPILGGAGIISGSFTLEEAKELALLLRSGALPASINVVQERTIGPSLGADSMEAGKLASILAIVLVAIFMIVRYRTFGLFASIAVLFNLMLIITGLSILNSTLTLPGIAGIVLTVGMSVDANVLIFERIKEMAKNLAQETSRKQFVKSIDEGFKNSISTILDSNLTTIATAITLYIVGFGAIRGFAITLILGILTSMFSSIFLTGAMLRMFANWKKFKLS
jgi:preprotein translocase subunit SecD